MRKDEEFVGRSIRDFCGGPDVATISEGEDPPDLYLTFTNHRVAVEVTWLSQSTFEPDGTLGNRLTQDKFGLRVLDKLDADLGSTLPNGMSLSIGIQLPVANAAPYQRKLKEWITEIAVNPKLGDCAEREIEGSKTFVSIIDARPSGKKIVGYVDSTNSSADIGLNARLTLENRIWKKNEVCKDVASPLWLGLLNDYWLADAGTYIAVAKEIRLTHRFDKVFLVSDGGQVCELHIGQ